MYINPIFLTRVLLVVSITLLRLFSSIWPLLLCALSICMCLSLSIEPLLTLPFTLEGDRWWIARAFDSSSVQQELHWPSCKPLSYIFLSALYSYGRCSLLLVCVLAKASYCFYIEMPLHFSFLKIFSILTPFQYRSSEVFLFWFVFLLIFFLFPFLSLFLFPFIVFSAFICLLNKSWLLFFFSFCFCMLHALFLHTDAYDGSKRLLGRFIFVSYSF